MALPDGSRVFVKPGTPRAVAAEAAGLGWLAEVEGVPVPRLVAVASDGLATAWIDHGSPSAAGGERLGRALAALHDAPCDAFGAPWPGCIGPLDQDNTSAERWSAFYASRRLEPFLARARDAGSIDAAGGDAVEAVIDRLDELAGPVEAPSRIHGDLWSGNVVWDGDGNAWMVDPAAHGGRRETDLAMLALFGAPQLDRIVAAYREMHPLADGWRRRVRLHQLHPLLVHAVLFGPSYGRRAAEVAASLLGTR